MEQPALIADRRLYCYTEWLDVGIILSSVRLSVCPYVQSLGAFSSCMVLCIMALRVGVGGFESCTIVFLERYFLFTYSDIFAVVWKVDLKSKPTEKLKHADSILEHFEYFCQMSSKLILIVKVCALFLRHSVVYHTVTVRSRCPVPCTGFY